jgi:hypothetical protein
VLAASISLGAAAAALFLRLICFVSRVAQGRWICRDACGAV